MIYQYKKLKPQIANSVFIAPNTNIIGEVSIDTDSSIWFNVTIRGDVHYIKIGKYTNIQDNCLLHVTNGKYPLTIGDKVTIGHSCTLHGCTIQSNTLIGMSATILDDVEIGEYSIVAAGSLLREGQKFEPGVLIAGNPAQVKRKLNTIERERNIQYAENYVRYKNNYLDRTQFFRIEE
jgi:carbonic anhydrase/acetyltransferase-like protein (isoleucine patch superfamily)